MTNSDFVHGPSSEVEGVPQYITLLEKATKTRRGGKHDRRELQGRIQMDLKRPELCPVRTLLLYQSKKTDEQKAPNFAFFLTIKQTAEKDPKKEMFWYTNQPMGVNLIGKLFANAITNSGIDVGNRRISATSARKNLAQVGASASIPSALLSKMLGQKNLDSKVHYVSNTENIQKAASLVIARGVQGHDSEDFSSVYNDLKTSKNRTDVYEPPSTVYPSESTNEETNHPVQLYQPEPQPTPGPSYVSQPQPNPGPSHVYQPYDYQSEPYYGHQSTSHSNYQALPPPPPPPYAYGYYHHSPPPYYPPPLPPHQHYYMHPSYYAQPPPQYPSHPYHAPFYQPPPTDAQNSGLNHYSLTQNNNYNYNNNWAENRDNWSRSEKMPSQPNEDSRKRVLTDISNNFTFKRPKID